MKTPIRSFGGLQQPAAFPVVAVMAFLPAIVRLSFRSSAPANYLAWLGPVFAAVCLTVNSRWLGAQRVVVWMLWITAIFLMEELMRGCCGSIHV